MKRIITFTILTLCIKTITYAQILSPWVIASTGGYYSQGGYTISETVAEMAAVTTLTGTNNILTQGFQQPDLTATGIEEISVGIWQIKVYPNPATDKVSIKVLTGDLQNAKVTLTNTMGQVILENTDIDLRDMLQIDLSAYTSGIYLVTISAADTQQTFRINKID